jgi:hypothetical protein
VSNYLELVRGLEQKQGSETDSTSGAKSAVSAQSHQGSGGVNRPAERGLVVCWSQYPKWIELRDP